MKKTNNKGFSLVELIVVIAIMAVLMVVVGPQLLRYVERARIQRDNTAISEIANAAKIAMADETINDVVNPGTTYSTIRAASGTITFGTADALTNELTLVLGATVDLESDAYSTGTPGIDIAKDANGNITVSGVGLVNQDGTALTITY